jgi:uncharacterized protein YdcH (DUF465 family)
MTKRVMLALFIVLLSATSAWPKFKEDEQQFLIEQFKAIQDQVQALTTQLQTLNAQVQELRQNQAQFQAIITRQQRSLQDLDQTVNSMHLGSEEDFSNLKMVVLQLRKETQDAFVKLSGGPVASVTGGGGAAPSAPPAPTTPAQGYVLVVDGNNLTLDTSALTGVHEGLHLALYKSSDLTTRVGVLTVTQMLDGGKSRAQVITLNSGVQPEFSDVVRLE